MDETDTMLSIVELLAKGADRMRLSPNELDLLNQQASALNEAFSAAVKAQAAATNEAMNIVLKSQQEFTKRFLAAIRAADGVIASGLVQTLGKIG